MPLAHPLPPPASRWRPVLVLLPLVLATHALLLGLLPMGVGSGWEGGVRPVMTVRQVTLPPAAAPVAQAVAAAEAEPPVAERPAAKAPAAAPAPEPAPAPAPATVAEATPPPEPAASAPPPTPEPPPVAEAAAAVAVAAALPTPADAATGGNAPPAYATRLPPPALLRFELRRGALSGSGDLRWRPEGGRYLLTMEGTAFSVTVINWQSEGGFDAAGIAPERFLDKRRGRNQMAANFQRTAGRITFSGPTVEYPLVPGAQDRLSWMLQLPAIVAADPAKYRPGARISLFVVGARGDGDVWTFDVEAVESIQMPAGRVENALRLHRRPRKEFDTQVDVWLDPAHGYLPARMRLQEASGDTTDFRLAERTAP